MKKLITTVVVIAVALMCTGAMALNVDINYGSGSGTGAKDSGATYLVGHMYPLFPAPTIDWTQDLVELWWAGDDEAIGGTGADADQLIDEVVIGWGRLGPVTTSASGEWTAEVTTSLLDSVTEDNKVYVRVYDKAKADKATALSVASDLIAITSDTSVNTITTPNLIIPEPSIMLVSGLALLLLRKRK